MAVKAIIFGVLLIVLGIGSFVATIGPGDVDATAKAIDRGGNLTKAIEKDAKAIGEHLDNAAERAAESIRTGEAQPVPPKYKVTALIPAFFGLALVVCGALAMKESRKKHAMHAAAMVGLLGFIGAFVMVVKELVRVMSDGGPLKRPTAFWSQCAMAALCVVFVVLCVQSFIAAKKARVAAQAGNTGG
jgi:hypothetical protein